VPDPEAQYTMGWSIICVTVLNMAVNICAMIYTSFKKLKLLFLKIKQKYQIWKALKQKKHAIDQEDKNKI
jgi:hypothetical protein